jgi:hypothetical protein
LKDGRTVLVIEAMEIETKAEAHALSAMLEKWAEGLPESKPRAPRKAKGKSSRQTGTPAKRSRKANGDVAHDDTEATQTSLV